MSMNNIKKQKINFQCRILVVRKMKNMIFADIISRGVKKQIKISPILYSDNNFIAGDYISLTGRLDKNNRGEELVEVEKLKIISKWLSNVPYGDIDKLHNNPLKIFAGSTYEEIFRVNSLRKSIRTFFDKCDFVEVQTPIVLNKYNGGKSFPVSSYYLKDRIGFNRTTMEERMQAIIGVGFDKIFQIGQTFRSEKERVNLECYCSSIDFSKAKIIIKQMMSFVLKDLCKTGLPKNINIDLMIKKKWKEIEFFDGIEEVLGIDRKFLYSPDQEKINKLIQMKIGIDKDCSPETLSDKLGMIIAKKYDCPLMINHFPVWCSPLYRKNDQYTLERTMVYYSTLTKPFDMGMQENNLTIFEQNLLRQKKDSNDLTMMEIESELKDIISAGLPQMFGLGMNIDRIFKIWGLDYGIDNYK
jgi:lysyl-tRNA synthetase class II